MSQTPSSERTSQTTSVGLNELQTPCLVLDAARMECNIARLREKLAGKGVKLRPHLKTGKFVEMARSVMDSAGGPAAVSTLEEATQFAKAGIRDMIYAVGIAPAKLGRVLALRDEGVDLTVLLDSVEQAEAVAATSREAGAPILASQTLREAGFPCPVASVGPTPTALSAVELKGVSEVRAGAFVFFDLMMAGIGICRIDDIALSVLGTVIGHQQERLDRD